MKTNLMAVAVAAATLTSVAAFADAPCDTHAAVQVFQQPPANQPDGRYELQSIETWVSARYEQVTVTECRETRQRRGNGWRNHHRRDERCYPVTRSQLVPAHYETVQEWVFIPYPPRHQHYSQYPGQRPPPGQVLVRR